ncbi:hypothetical protein [Cryobacterium sp. SO1]|uniref:hypothetical protein n=1 Tax=Cryobacterium sp. SO1 TaxID=1897061 RepID=UPI001022F59D|nr:hypothetical protein [Cryobacterium sp. SO1]RZI35337.1 hypothetical protein BJQ95_02404 [Cryobacterium sp. SO1]
MPATELATVYVKIDDIQVADATNTTPDRALIKHDGVGYTFRVEVVDPEKRFKRDVDRVAQRFEAQGDAE